MKRFLKPGFFEIKTKIKMNFILEKSLSEREARIAYLEIHPEHVTSYDLENFHTCFPGGTKRNLVISSVLSKEGNGIALDRAHYFISMDGFIRKLNRSPEKIERFIKSLTLKYKESLIDALEKNDDVFKDKLLDEWRNIVNQIHENPFSLQLYQELRKAGYTHQYLIA